MCHARPRFSLCCRGASADRRQVAGNHKKRHARCAGPKTSGQVLTGTLTRDGESSTITDGKVSKSKVTFKAILGEQEEALTGQLDGEQLKVWLDRQGPEGAVDFKRLKE